MGALIIPMVCFERVVLGFHSIGQVTVGSSIGVLLYIYTSRVPQFFVLFDAMIQASRSFY